MAQEDYFLKIDGIEGESTQKGHEQEIEIAGWAWEARNAGSFAGNMGGGSGKVVMRDFKFYVQANKATPKLFLACCTGDHIKSATLTCRKAGKTPQEYLKWKFTDLLISSYTIGGGITERGVVSRRQSSAGDPGSDVESGDIFIMPTDQITFNFTKVEISYAPQKADGSLDAAMPAGFNLKTGTKV